MIPALRIIMSGHEHPNQRVADLAHGESPPAFGNKQTDSGEPSTSEAGHASSKASLDALSNTNEDSFYVSVLANMDSLGIDSSNDMAEQPGDLENDDTRAKAITRQVVHL